MKITKRRLLIALAALALLVTLYLCAPYYPFGGEIVSHGPDTERAVALTFDDGPNARYTPAILEILDHYDAKGTFFVVGTNVERHPDTAQMIVERGHQIANHSHDHSNFLPYLTPNFVVDDYRRANDAILRATGVSPMFYRAPHGRITPWMRWALRRQGLTLTGWDCSTDDWNNPGVEELISRVVQDVRPGSIVLLHDGLDTEDSPDRSQLVQALPAIIEQLQDQGYKLVTVARLLGREPYS